ncbi:MAG: hypothetical protein J6Y45_02840 [Bacteroidales bacterium]|nr:hypothetical protein [Bacteroidales bacterium]
MAGILTSRRFASGGLRQGPAGTPVRKGQSRAGKPLPERGGTSGDVKSRRKLSAGSVAALVVGVLVLGAAVYIMVHGLGLNPDLDFGAGAYYYADIPDYQNTLNWDTFTARLPFWVYVLLFLGWGALMWRLWKRLDR